MSRSEGGKSGATPQSQFRLGELTLAELDELVRWYAEESGDRETRTSVLRKLIRREYARLAKKREG